MSCPEEYKNLGLKSFGEQKYVTADILRQFCKNDAYLKKMVDKLEYLTPPAVRKVFSDIPVNDINSFGYTRGEKNTIIFDDTHGMTLEFDFNDLNYVDLNKTTAIRTSFVSQGEVIQKFEVPKETQSHVDSTTRNYSPWTIYEKDEEGHIVWEDENKKIPKLLSDDMTCNEFWYIGFDRNRHYETRPNWLENMLNGEIPGISRAQTFKAKTTGLLESVRLNLKGSTNTGMPLIVQIRKTKEIDGIAYPVDSDEKHLAHTSIVFGKTDPGVYSVVFDHPCTVKEGETYAIVLLSPLSHPTNCYWIGGWNKHCHADVYEEGNAFYSANSGYTWIRYGKDDSETGEEVEYHAGKYAPQDFAFICDIREQKEVYKSDGPYYLYLKPILVNPINSVTLHADSGGATATDGHTLRFEVSSNGRVWEEISGTKFFNEPTKTLFVRAILTSNGTNTSYVEKISLHLDMEVPNEMYVRTCAYYPPLTGILSASVWGRVYAPFTTDPDTNCTVEIIREKEVTDHFIIIEPSQLEEYVLLIPSLKNSVYASEIIGKNETQIIEYLNNKPSFISLLRDCSIYIKGFISDFKLWQKPAYPIISTFLQPDFDKTKSYGEWYDFTVDYDKDTLSFFEDIDLPRGHLSVTYNPVFMDGLTNEEIGFASNNNEGLILDYFEESVIVDEEMMTNRRIELRAEPVDPIRKVTVLKGNGDEYELTENIDYTIEEKTIVLDIVNYDGESPIISLNDIVKIVYTPNLDDNGISLGYHATRNNTDKNVVIKPNYIEYKA